MRISVIGTGYLGAVHAACMAELGHDVLGVDVDENRIRQLSLGLSPMYEPGFPELLKKHVDTGRLRFSTSLREAAEFGDTHFICVGTPELRGAAGAADMAYLDTAVKGLAPHLVRPALLVGKSTVPVGTAARLTDMVRSIAPAGNRVEVAWNPEFLREGFAVLDTMHPDRLVLGVASPAAEDTLRRVYQQALAGGTPCICTDPSTAELVKVSANAFLATKISFINAISEICEAAGADVMHVSAALGLDGRIGPRFLSPGLSFGGGCLPKDIRAFLASAREIGAGQALTFLEGIEDINVRQRRTAVDVAREMLGGSVEGRRVAVLGAAFKPNSDDVRDSPALSVAKALHDEGASVRVHDPRAVDNARAVHPDLSYSYEVQKAFEGCELALHLTEWQEYRDLDAGHLSSLVAAPRILDARNKLDIDYWRKSGWTVRAMGRPNR